ncbi:MAG: LysM peptidoglycan-binding domain-containing M23 family metallopeptidase [Cystobacterineae bacterium]|nr:LysM peptidoglycan-binding domain-containing M23 family metallopeptidase [Cystobacterineae bacterium]
MLLLLLACWTAACPKTGVVRQEGFSPDTRGKTTQSPKTSDTQEVGDLPVHTVAKGETFYGIARSHGVLLAELLAVNGLRETDVLQVGQPLLIPASSIPLEGRPIGPGERGGAVSGFSLEWPLQGMLYAKFGKKGKEIHDGIDLAAPLGTPVKAAAGGKVLYAGEQKGYGNIVIIEHTAGLITLYAHNHELRIQAGDKVAAGAVIATVGQSGRTSGPHLHFELRKNGIAVDPLPYLRPLP